MCISGLVQIVYGILCLAGIAATIVAMVTPGWQDWEKAKDNLQQGLWPFDCAYPDGRKTDASYCEEWYNNLPWTEKVVVACMILAAAVQIICFLYNIFTFCACCCKGCLLPLLAIITVIVDVLLAIAVILYAIDNHSYIDPLNHVFHGNPPDSKVGWSFWLACVALIINIVNTLVAGLASCCATICC